MRKHPAEEPILRLVKDGLGDQEIAEKVGTTPNHIWAVRAYSGIRPVTEKQLKIARAIVNRKRRAALAAVPAVRRSK